MICATSRARTWPRVAAARSRRCSRHFGSAGPARSARRENVIVEIRAGEGGEEAALSRSTFTGCPRATPDATAEGEVLSPKRRGEGCFKKIIFRIAGKGAYRSSSSSRACTASSACPATGHRDASTPPPRRSRSSGGGGDRHPDPRERSEDRRLPRRRQGRPGLKHDRLGRADHPHPDRRGGDLQDERSQLKNRAKAWPCCARVSLCASNSGVISRPAQPAARRSAAATLGEMRTYNFPQDRSPTSALATTSRTSNAAWTATSTTDRGARTAGRSRAAVQPRDDAD